MTCAKVFILHVVATVSSRSSESSWASSSPALSPLRRVAASRSMSSVIAEARRISLSNADCETHKHTDTPTEKEREKKKKKGGEREGGTPHQHEECRLPATIAVALFGSRRSSRDGEGIGCSLPYPTAVSHQSLCLLGGLLVRLSSLIHNKPHGWRIPSRPTHQQQLVPHP